MVVPVFSAGADMVALVGKRKPKPRVFDGAKLREYRESRRPPMTQAELAEAADVHRVDVVRYEAGDVEPSLAVTVRLAKALGVEVKGLLRDEPG